MTGKLWLSLLGALLVAPQCAPAAPAEIDVKDDHGRPLAGAVVELVPEQPGEARVANGLASEGVIDQRNETFIPLVTLIREGGHVVFENNDTTMHQVYSFSLIKQFAFEIDEGQRSVPVVFDKPGVAAIGCNIHDRMITYVYVAATPWAAISELSGRALLADMPPGTYRGRVWHPQLPPVTTASTFSLTVAASGGRTDVALPISAAIATGKTPTLVCVQAATAVFAYVYMRQRVVERGRRELSLAMQAFARQIDFLSQRVSDGVEVLALDYALRAAIANSDHGTELSVLRNHGRRIGAARMLLVKLDGSIAADTAGAAREGSAFQFAPLLVAATSEARGTSLATFDDRLYWIIAVPVRAPVAIAFIVAWIPIDNDLLDSMRHISSSPHAILLAVRGAGGRWRVAAHTRGDSHLVLPAIGGSTESTQIINRDGFETLAIVSPLRTDAGSRLAAAVIELPLQEALEGYRGLITPMLMLLVLALFAAAGGATMIVRRFARPLETLASAAQHIEAGDYSVPAVPPSGRDEIGRLSQSIGSMARAIAERESALTGAMEAAGLARDEAVRANDAKSQFLANMSHELRTPLNAVIGFSEMLELQVLGPLGVARYADYARDIREAGEHLRGVFQQMIDLAQAESHSLSVASEPLRAMSLVKEALEIHRGFARRARVFVAVTPGLESVEIIGDAAKLRQSFANVIHNAIKFTSPGGSITVSGCREGERVTVRISDTGAGIKPELLESVTKAFHRQRSALDGRYQGAGLGLAYAKSIVELHGGTVSVASEFGEGTTVTIGLPLARQSIEHAA